MNELQKIAQALREDSLILCFGPKLDAELGIPSLDAGLEPLLAKAAEADRKQVMSWWEDHDLPRLAEYFFRNHRVDYQGALKVALDLRPGFAHRHFPDWLNTLKTLAPKRLVCTQAHNLFNLLFPDHRLLLWDEAIGLAEGLPADAPWLCQSHGIIDEPSSLVIAHGQRQAHSIKIDRALRQNVLKHLFAKYWLFCGFDAADPLIRAPLEWAIKAGLSYQGWCLSLDTNEQDISPLVHLTLPQQPADFSGSALDYWFRQLAAVLDQPLTPLAVDTSAHYRPDPAFRLLRQADLSELTPPDDQAVRDFYHGGHPTPELVHFGHSVTRSETAKILTALDKDKRLVLLSGASGEGKNTIVLQVALDLLAEGWEVCLADRSDSELMNLARLHKKPLAVLVFRADQIANLDQLAQVMSQRGSRGFLLLAARPHEWVHRNRLLGQQLKPFEITIQALDAAQLGELEERLARYHPEKKRADLKQALSKAGSDLFAAMLAATHGKELYRILADMVDRIMGWRDGNRLRDALGLVCYFEQYLNRPCPRLLFQACLGLKSDESPGFCAQLTGELSLSQDETRVTTRHATIGKALFQVLFSDQPRLNEAEIAKQLLWGMSHLLVQKQSLDHRKLLTQIPCLYRKHNPDLADHLFQVASKVSPHDVHVWQEWAMFAKTRRLGPVTEPLSARWLFKRATEADPRHAPAWQAWALLEKKQGNFGSLDQVHSARWLFKRATEANPLDAPSWQAWALLEKDQNNIGSLDQVHSARWLFKRATEADAHDAPSWHAWALLEFEQGKKNEAYGILARALDNCPKAPELLQLQRQMQSKPGGTARAAAVSLKPRPGTEYGCLTYADEVLDDPKASYHQILDAFDSILPLMVKPCLVMAQWQVMEEDPQLILVWPGSNHYRIFVATTNAKLMHFNCPKSIKGSPEPPQAKTFFQVEEFLGFRDEVLGLYFHPQSFSQTPDLILACRINGVHQSYRFPLDQLEQPPSKGSRMPEWMKLCPVQLAEWYAQPPVPPDPFATSALWSEGRYYRTAHLPQVTEEAETRFYGDFIHQLGEQRLTIKANQSITGYDQNGKRAWRWFTDRQALCLVPLDTDQFLVGEDGGHLVAVKLMPEGRNWGKRYLARFKQKLKHALKLVSFDDVARSICRFLDHEIQHWPTDRKAPKAAALYLLLEELLANSEDLEEQTLQELAPLFRRLYNDAEFLWLMPLIRHRIRDWKNICTGARVVFHFYQYLPYSQQDIVDLELQRHLVEIENNRPGAYGTELDKEAYRVLTRQAVVDRQKLYEETQAKDKRAAIAMETHVDHLTMAYTSRAVQQEPDGVLRRLSEAGPLFWILKNQVFKITGVHQERFEEPLLDLGFTPLVRIALTVKGKPALFMADSKCYTWVLEEELERYEDGKPMTLPQGKFPADRTLLQGTKADDNRVHLIFKIHKSGKIGLSLLNLLTASEKLTEGDLHPPTEVATMRSRSGGMVLVSNLHQVGIELDDVIETDDRISLEYKEQNRKFFGRIRSLVAIGPQEILVGTTEGFLQRLSWKEESDGTAGDISVIWQRYLGSAVKHLDFLGEGDELRILALTADSDAFILKGNGEIDWAHRVHTVFRSGALFKEKGVLYAAMTDARGALAVFHEKTPMPLDYADAPRSGTVHDALQAIDKGQHPHQFDEEDFRKHLSTLARQYLVLRLSREKCLDALNKVMPRLNHEEILCALRNWPGLPPLTLYRGIIHNLAYDRHRWLHGSQWDNLRARILDEILFLTKGQAQMVRSELLSDWPLEWLEHPAVAAAFLQILNIEGDKVQRFSRLLEASTFLGPRGLVAVGMLAPASKTKLSYYLLRCIKHLEGKGPAPRWHLEYDQVRVLDAAKGFLTVVRLLAEREPSWEKITLMALELKRACPNGLEGVHPDLALLWTMLAPFAIEQGYDQRPLAEQLDLLTELESVPLLRPNGHGPWNDWLNAVIDRFNRMRQMAIGHRRAHLQALRRGILRNLHIQRLAQDAALCTAELATEGAAGPTAVVTLEVVPQGAQITGQTTMSWRWDQLPQTLRWNLRVGEITLLQIKVHTQEGHYQHIDLFAYPIETQVIQETLLQQAPGLVSAWVDTLADGTNAWVIGACEENLGLKPLADALNVRSFRVCDLDDAMSKVGQGRERPLGFHAEAILKNLGAIQHQDVWSFPQHQGRRDVVAWPCEDTVQRLLHHEHRSVLDALARAMQQVRSVRVIWLLPWRLAQQLQVKARTPLRPVWRLPERLTEEVLPWVRSRPEGEEAEIALRACEGDFRLFFTWLRKSGSWAAFREGLAFKTFLRECLAGLSYGAYAELLLLCRTITTLPAGKITAEMSVPINGTIGQAYARSKEGEVMGIDPALEHLMKTVAPDLQKSDTSLLLEREVLGETEGVRFVRRPFQECLCRSLQGCTKPFQLIEEMMTGTLKNVLGLRELATLGIYAEDIYPSMVKQGRTLLDALKDYLEDPKGNSAKATIVRCLRGTHSSPPAEILDALAKLGRTRGYQLAMQGVQGEFFLCFLDEAGEDDLTRLACPEGSYCLVILGPRLMDAQFPAHSHICLLNQVSLLEMVSAEAPTVALTIILRNRLGLSRFNPYQVGNMLKVGSDVFVGREHEIETILGQYKERSFLILGGRQIGKTSLLQHLLGRIRKSGETLPLYLDCQGVSNMDGFTNTVKRACQAEMLTWPELAGLPETLERMSSPKPLTLLINEVDGLSLREPQVLQVLRSLSEQGVCQAIMVGYQGAFGGLTNPNHPFFHWVYVSASQKAFVLGALSKEAATELIEKLSKSDLALRWQDEETHALGIQALLQRSHRIPILLQRACDDLVRRLEQQRRTVITRQDFEELYSGSDLPAWTFINEIRIKTDFWFSSDTLDQYVSHFILALAVYNHYPGLGEEQSLAPYLADPRQQAFELVDVKRYVEHWCGKKSNFTKNMMRWPLDYYRNLMDFWCLTVVLSDHPGEVQSYYFTENIYPLELHAYLLRSNLTLTQYLKKMEGYVSSVLGEGESQ